VTKVTEMQSAAHLPTATILPFKPRQLVDNRLTAQDRIDALIWESTADTINCGRMIIHHRQHNDDPEIGDFISIYKQNSNWATWGVARRGRVVSLWQCATGADLGEFETMREALASIPATLRMPSQALA